MTETSISVSTQPLNDTLARGTVTIAVDTEYQGNETLSIQTAVRLPDGIISVQLYHSPSVLPPPPECSCTRLLEVLGEKGSEQTGGRIILRPAKVISERMNLLDLLRDSLGLTGVKRLSRKEGQCPRVIPAEPVGFVPTAFTSPIVEITVVLVGAFLVADFARIMGSRCWRSLLGRRPGRKPEFALDVGKVIGLLAGTEGKHYRPPVVAYGRLPDGRVLAVRLTTRDTCLPFGGGSLDGHSMTFVGVGKSNMLNSEDKEHMLEAFRARPLDTYLYAARDAVLTLLVYEGMMRCDREVYQRLGVADDTIPDMRRTLGGRAIQFIELFAMQHANGSERLKSRAVLRRLMAGGGRSTFENPRVSRYGCQTGDVHGGSIYTRTPTVFWHEAPGLLRDVDLSGCYACILARMELAWGRPVVWEPGCKPLQLQQVVQFLQTHCQSDMWFVRVTGSITKAPNVLIPSTDEAITSENYIRVQEKEEREGTRLFAQRVESGVVTYATWLMIGALPPGLRSEYESLRVDSVVFYPTKWLAQDGPAFDRLVTELSSDTVPWSESIDLSRMKKHIVEHIDARFVALRFPIGEYVRKLVECREEAKRIQGAKSGGEKAWKSLANTVYGVLASEHASTSNVVAANVTTATARALAFAMMMTLNGIQVITDGCTYRRDRIPACTFAECLRRMPEYPLRHATGEENIPFLDPQEIPDEDGHFTTWLVARFGWFFDARGEGYDWLFGMHQLAHKLTPGTQSPAFDGLATDGPANYIKCLKLSDGSWQSREAALRGCGAKAKEVLIPWILQSYVSDRLSNLPPPAIDTVLLKLKEAIIQANAALRAGIRELLLPLGYLATKVRMYKCIRCSAFIFDNPNQLRTINRQLEKFNEIHGCGLEVLALRRGYAGRDPGSLHTVAQAIYELIRAGKTDLTKTLHLDRLSEPVKNVIRLRQAWADRLRFDATRSLYESMSIGEAHAHPLTGIDARLVE